MKYYQLNTNTSYDFSKSTILPDEYCSRAKELGYEGVGFADPLLYSFPSFYSACLKHSLTPIGGLRIVLASSDTHPINAVLYILNEKGYLNLCSLFSKSKSEYGIDDLKAIHEGLALVIETDSDFFDSLFQKLISPLLTHYRKIFEESFYLGISIYDDKDRENISSLYDFADKLQYQILVFPKVKYLRKTDAYKTTLLSKAYNKEKAFDIANEGPNFLLSPKALDQIYREKDLQSTSDFVNQIHFNFFTKRGKLISFDNDKEVLFDKTHTGLKERMGEDIPSCYQERLKYELEVIDKMNFNSYFLLVSDYVSFAKSVKIKVGPGRGSAGGSLVSFSLGITDLDPLKYHLSFERFLNPKRQTMPDIDIDFEDDRRNEVVAYLKKKYSPEHVSEIVTFQTLKPKSVLNLIAPALGFNELRLKKLTSSISGKADDFRQALLDPFFGPRFRKLIEDPYYHEIVEKAKGLIGLPINNSIHAAGVIISEDPIFKCCPVSNQTVGTVGYEYPYMEKLGYLKCDILGLSNLAFISSIENRIRQSGKKLENPADHLDDTKTFKILNSLSLSFIFQLESRGMKETVKTIEPTTFSDIASIIALYRPGPMAYIKTFSDRKHHLIKTTYATELLHPILEETYGIMVYQEEVMEALKAVAGFSSSDADLFRRAISKKNKDIMSEYKKQFLIGAGEKGIDNETAENIYKDIEKFSDYGFNKSHAYCYAMIVFTLLYYKANYPQEFYDVALNFTSLNNDKFVDIGVELKNLGYTIMAPDINISQAENLVFANGKAFLPLNCITSLDKKAINELISNRNSMPYTSFYNFISRNLTSIDPKNTKTITAMIECGVFDSLSKGRKALKDNLSTYLGFAKMGFEESTLLPLDLNDEDLGERLNYEKASLGIILSTRMSKIEFKPGYKTLIVSDESSYDMNQTIKAVSENQEYVIQLDPKEKPEKNSFILVKAEFRKKGRTYPIDVILLGKRKAN
ncbi:MAG: DNA polymerase III subunit alpha [Bacilli bacterium]